VRVGKWACWEQTFRASRAFDNPFKDVRVTVQFVGPVGQRVEREAFYSGDGQWVCRFAPEAVGEWSWTIRSEPEDAGLAGGGSLECVASELHGVLRVSEDNPLWFTFADGTPVYILSFHLWQGEALKPDILASTLNYLEKQGFNAIDGPHLGADRMVWEHSPDGQPDFSRFDLAVWANLDRLVEELARRGMPIFPFSIMGGTNRLPAPRDPAARDLFLRYWVARWGAFWNVTYQMVSEYEEGYSDEEILSLGARLRELDGGRHLVSVHSQKAGSEAVQKAAWYGYHTVQDKLGHRAGRGDAADDDPLKYRWFTDLHRRVPKPILAQECLWEGNFYQAEVGLNVDILRKGAWVIALNGGQINYADEVMPPRKSREQQAYTAPIFSRRGTEVQPRGELYPALTHLAAFMRSLPFERLRLHPELASTGVCLADPGRICVVYSPAGGAIELDLTGADRSFQCEWFDPRSGRRQAGPTLPGGARREVRSPDEHDWVLTVK